MITCHNRLVLVTRFLQPNVQIILDLHLRLHADQGTAMMRQLHMIAAILVIPLRMSDYHIYLVRWVISGAKDFQCPPSVGKNFQPLASHPDLKTLTGAESYTTFLWSFHTSLRDPGMIFSLCISRMSPTVVSHWISKSWSHPYASIQSKTVYHANYTVCSCIYSCITPVHCVRIQYSTKRVCCEFYINVTMNTCHSVHTPVMMYP